MEPVYIFFSRIFLFRFCQQENAGEENIDCGNSTASCKYICQRIPDQPLNKFFNTNQRFAGLSANRRMKYGYQYSPYGT